MRRFLATGLLALCLLFGGFVNAQVSSNTVLQGHQLSIATNTKRTPEGTATVTPTANALVILAVTWHHSSLTPVIDTVSEPWGAWTLAGTVGPTGGDDLRSSIYWALAGATPATDAVTITFTANFQASGASLYEYATGYDTTTPIAQVGTAEAASLAGNVDLNGTFGATPDADSQLFQISQAASNNRFGPSDAATGWTKLTPTEEGSNQTSWAATAAGTAGTGFGIDFGDATPADDHNDGAQFLAIEIAAEAAGGATIPLTLQNLGRAYGPQRSQQLGGLLQ